MSQSTVTTPRRLRVLAAAIAALLAAVSGLVSAVVFGPLGALVAAVGAPTGAIVGLLLAPRMLRARLAMVAATETALLAFTIGSVGYGLVLTAIYAGDLSSIAELPMLLFSMTLLVAMYAIALAGPQTVLVAILSTLLLRRTAPRADMSWIVAAALTTTVILAGLGILAAQSGL